MSEHTDRVLPSPAGRARGGNGGARGVEGALFTAAVFAVSLLAFSATTGSTSRAYERIAGVVGAACQPAAAPAPPGAAP